MNQTLKKKIFLERPHNQKNNRPRNQKVLAGHVAYSMMQITQVSKGLFSASPLRPPIVMSCSMNVVSNNLLGIE